MRFTNRQPELRAAADFVSVLSFYAFVVHLTRYTVFGPYLFGLGPIVIVTHRSWLLKLRKLIGEQTKSGSN